MSFILNTHIWLGYVTSLSLQYGRFHYNAFANIQTPKTSSFFDRFKWNWYQNAWLIKISHIQHSNHHGCRPFKQTHDVKKVWYPGSGVVLDCIDFWSFSSFLLSYVLHLMQISLNFFRRFQTQTVRESAKNII